MKFLSMLPGQKLIMTRTPKIQKVVVVKPRSYGPKITIFALIGLIVFSLIVNPLTQHMTVSKQKMIVLGIVGGVTMTVIVEDVNEKILNIKRGRE